MLEARPTVDPAVRNLRQDFRAISISADLQDDWAVRSHPDWLSAANESLVYAAWAQDHVQAWRDAFASFGAQPKKTPSSVEALRVRAARGVMPPINPVVDLYNAVSIRFALPIGGEDFQTYSGQPMLTRANGDETFETVRDGVDMIDTPKAGEVIWRDALGATCRRWNWRQCRRTRVTAKSRSLWFVLEALEPMPDLALVEAADALCEGLSAISPTASMSIERLP